jgi:hypothetical protein
MARVANELSVLSPGGVTLAQLRGMRDERLPVRLHEGALKEVEAAHRVVARILERGTVAYGINTGFGKFVHQTIPADRLGELQRNLVLSHSAGTGALLSDQVVRLVMILKAIGLGRGCSGVRPEVVEALLALVNARVYPCITSRLSESSPAIKHQTPLVGFRNGLRGGDEEWRRLRRCRCRRVPPGDHILAGLDQPLQRRAVVDLSHAVGLVAEHFDDPEQPRHMRRGDGFAQPPDR